MTQYVAKRFIASQPNTELIAQLAQGNIQSIKSEETNPLLKKYHLDNIPSDGWIPLQPHLDFYREVIETTENATENLIAIGMKGAEFSPVPDYVKSLDDVMEMMKQYYAMTHRNYAEGEGVSVRRLNEKHYKVIFNTPYPVEMLYGYVWGLVKRFRPKNVTFAVRLLDEKIPDAPGDVMDIVLN